MSLTRYQSSESTPVRSTFVNAAGNGITGLSPTMRIQRVNGDYLDVVGNTWAAAPTNPDHPMAEVDAVRKPGEYNFTFNPSGTTGVNAVDKYTFRSDGTATAVNRIQSAGAVFGDFLTAAERNAVADSLLSRDVDNVEATMALHSLGSVVLKQVSRFVIDQVLDEARTYRTDGATVHLTQALVKNAALVATQELAAGV